MNDIGHNSAAEAKANLRSIIDRVEEKELEKKSLSQDIGDIYVEAKSKGLDVKAIKAIVRRRKEDPKERAELDAIIAAYMSALDQVD